jgi:hypothetical protein
VCPAGSDPQLVTGLALKSLRVPIPLNLDYEGRTKEKEITASCHEEGLPKSHATGYWSGRKEKPSIRRLNRHSTLVCARFFFLVGCRDLFDQVVFISSRPAIGAAGFFPSTDPTWFLLSAVATLLDADAIFHLLLLKLGVENILRQTLIRRRERQLHQLHQLHQLRQPLQRPHTSNQPPEKRAQTKCQRALGERVAKGLTGSRRHQGARTAVGSIRAGCRVPPHANLGTA